MEKKLRRWLQLEEAYSSVYVDRHNSWLDSLFEANRTVARYGDLWHSHLATH